MQPLLLGYIMEHFERMEVINQSKVYTYASELCLLSLLYVLVRHAYFFNISIIMMDVRIACCALVYKKVLSYSKCILSKLLYFISVSVRNFYPKSLNG